MAGWSWSWSSGLHWMHPCALTAVPVRRVSGQFAGRDGRAGGPRPINGPWLLFDAAEFVSWGAVRAASVMELAIVWHPWMESRCIKAVLRCLLASQ
ncbi:hypothetical protein V8C26DRAFT_390506 [Trichoderma gracile]